LIWLKFLTNCIPRQLFQKFEPSLCRILSSLFHMFPLILRDFVSSNFISSTSPLTAKVCSCVSFIACFMWII
jgi:hypothetical protein